MKILELVSSRKAREKLKIQRIHSQDSEQIVVDTELTFDKQNVICSLYVIPVTTDFLIYLSARGSVRQKIQ